MLVNSKKSIRQLYFIKFARKKGSINVKNNLMSKLQISFITNKLLGRQTKHDFRVASTFETCFKI